MEIRNENYFVVKGFMINELNLKGNELMIYAIIYGFSQSENQYFTGSLNYLMSWTGGTDKKTVIKTLNSLIKKGLIKKEEEIRNNVKYCKYKAISIFQKTLNLGGGENPLDSGKNPMGSGEIPREVVEKMDWGGGEIPPNNIDIIYI